MQRQHLPLQSGSRFREPRKIFWHDLPWIIDQGSKTPSRVPFLLVLDTTSCRRGRRSPQPDMIRKGRHYNAGCGGGSPEQRNVHAPRNGARERERELLHCWRSIALPFSERRTGVPMEGGALLPKRGRPKKRNALNANQMDGVNGGGMDW